MSLEVKRQLFHLLLGSAIALAVWLLKPAYGNFILIPLVAAVLLLLAAPKLAPKLGASNHLLTHFERKKDAKTFPYKGAIFYGVGIFFPIVLLPVELACIVVLILSVGDAASTLVGKFHGRVRIWDKTLEGSMAFVLFSFMASILFLKLSGRMDLIKEVFVLNVIGALVEIQSMVDDNLAVPLALTIVVKLFGL